MIQILCSVCGVPLESPRSRRLRIGQRCKWKRDGRPKRKRSSNVSQGMPISDVPYKYSGNEKYQQMKIGDF